MKDKAIFTLTFISMTVVGMMSAQASGSYANSHKHDAQESAVGKPATESEATKKIQVVTKDSMRYVFSPEPDIKTGDIVTFTIINEGLIPHEFSIGDKSEQDSHRKMMQDMPAMVHEDGNSITVKPGETKRLTWDFSGFTQGSSEVIFACNVPGHFEAGMFHKMTVNQQGVLTPSENAKHDDQDIHHHE